MNINKEIKKAIVLKKCLEKKVLAEVGKTIKGYIDFDKRNNIIYVKEKEHAASFLKKNKEEIELSIGENIIYEKVEKYLINNENSRKVYKRKIINILNKINIYKMTENNKKEVEMLKNILNMDSNGELNESKEEKIIEIDGINKYMAIKEIKELKRVLDKREMVEVAKTNEGYIRYEKNGKISVVNNVNEATKLNKNNEEYLKKEYEIEKIVIDKRIKNEKLRNQYNGRILYLMRKFELSEDKILLKKEMKDGILDEKKDKKEIKYKINANWLNYDLKVIEFDNAIIFEMYNKEMEEWIKKDSKNKKYMIIGKGIRECVKKDEAIENVIRDIIERIKELVKDAIKNWEESDWEERTLEREKILIKFGEIKDIIIKINENGFEYEMEEKKIFDKNRRKVERFARENYIKYWVKKNINKKDIRGKI